MFSQGVDNLWGEEQERKAIKGIESITVYHGARRETTVREKRAGLHEKEKTST